MAEQRKLPIGIEDFEKIRREGFYYVDKTGLIRELLQNWAEANLFTRPRRFGKTLNMSMLRCFFGIGCDEKLFEGLEISRETELCQNYMGKFPVISISLKGTDSLNFAGARAAVCRIIAVEALRFYELLMRSDRLNETDRERYRSLVRVDADSPLGEFPMTDDILRGSLRTLSELLYKHYGSKAVLLIDEYDVPLAKANEGGYYDEMVSLMRGLFEYALKTNEFLQFSVLTGCLRVAKESIFTGLNNFYVHSITDVVFDEYFGFTDAEVRRLLDSYELGAVYDTVKEWYDGYCFGNVEVYCPWDVICYCGKRRYDPELQPQNYWANTSGNDIVKHFVEDMEKWPGEGSEQAKLTQAEMERLINGGMVQKVIRQELTYRDLYATVDNLWSTLFMTGYLTQRGKPEGNLYSLVIPNREIRNIFMEQIMALFRSEVRNDGFLVKELCAALEQGCPEEAQRCFTAFMNKTVSIRDSFARKPIRENFYHGLLLGIFSFQPGWLVFSNREAGDGFADILVLIEKAAVGIVIEIKYAHDGNMEAVCRRALTQIDTKRYAEDFEDYDIRTVLKYGIA
ncbi:MAG: AAA family ATPase, partial [Eubacteriales bacterium]|nr:AAA family ATPase [Eubacteriales bacterium]